MTKILISSINESFVKINTDIGTLQEISDSFKFRVDGYQFMPAYKMGYFDGYIRLVDGKTGKIPKGIIPELLKWCNEREYDIVVEPEIVKPFKTKIEFNEKDLNIPFELRDYQLDAINRCLIKKRQIILASTGSGKSLIIYSIIRALESMVNDKILLIVPSISLVYQMYSDFENYSKRTKWKAEENVHKICEGAPKKTDKPIVISTWQSLQLAVKNNPAYFNQFQAVLFDEVHSCTGKVVASVMESCTKAFYRFGFTGTLNDSKTNEMQLKSLFGPVHRVSNTKDLMEKGVLADLEIKCIILKHDKEISELAKKFTYQNEMDHIVRDEKRNRFICNLVSTRKQNTLVLFQFVEKHGKKLKTMLEQKCEGKQVHFVFGGTEAEQRENIRNIMERTSPGNIFNFGNFSLKVPDNIDIFLSDGSTKLSQHCTEEDDISDSWIKENMKYKYK